MRSGINTIVSALLLVLVVVGLVALLYYLGLAYVGATGATVMVWTEACSDGKYTYVVAHVYVSGELSTQPSFTAVTSNGIFSPVAVFGPLRHPEPGNNDYVLVFDANQVLGKFVLEVKIGGSTTAAETVEAGACT